MIQTPTYRTNLGPLYAALMAVAWLSIHVFGVFYLNIAEHAALTVGLILFQTWLYVGLFIAAHDAIHGTLFRRGSPWNDRVGTVIHFLYAGFDYKLMKDAHIQHHKTPGTADDPDFNAENPSAFLPWYVRFFLRYFKMRQLFVLAGMSVIHLLLGASLPNLLLLWALPAIISSVQLFYFGTYLPHRHRDAFADHHNARSNSVPRWLSLLTCFHFGYHHEHHLYPDEPWWRLPARRKESLS